MLVTTDPGAAHPVELDRVSLAIGGRPILRDVDLIVRQGDTVTLLGPNGSGKTTCFYAIAGLVAPEGGQVIIDGQDATRLPMYRRAQLGLGYLPQEMSIFRGLAVEDNILAILEIAEPSPKKRRVVAIEPMITDGEAETRVLDDDWTVATVDGSMASHWEHSVAVHARGIWVLTLADGGASRLVPLGVTPVAP